MSAERPPWRRERRRQETVPSGGEFTRDIFILDMPKTSIDRVARVVHTVMGFPEEASIRHPHGRHLLGPPV